MVVNAWWNRFECFVLRHTHTHTHTCASTHARSPNPSENIFTHTPNSVCCDHWTLHVDTQFQLQIRVPAADLVPTVANRSPHPSAPTTTTTTWPRHHCPHRHSLLRPPSELHPAPPPPASARSRPACQVPAESPLYRRLSHSESPSTAAALCPGHRITVDIIVTPLP